MKNFEVQEIMFYQVVRTVYVLASNKQDAIEKARKKGMTGHLNVIEF